MGIAARGPHLNFFLFISVNVCGVCGGGGGDKRNCKYIHVMQSIQKGHLKV